MGKRSPNGTYSKKGHFCHFHRHELKNLLKCIGIDFHKNSWIHFWDVQVINLENHIQHKRDRNLAVSLPSKFIEFWRKSLTEHYRDYELLEIWRTSIFYCERKPLTRHDCAERRVAGQETGGDAKVAGDGGKRIGKGERGVGTKRCRNGETATSRANVAGRAELEGETNSRTLGVSWSIFHSHILIDLSSIFYNNFFLKSWNLERVDRFSILV